MFSKKLLQIAAVGLTTIAVLAGCGADEASDSSKDGDSSKVRTIKVAYDQASKPITYTDDQGNPTGYDVEVMKLVDELLPDYKFEYVPTTSDDLLIGVEQGKYQVGVKNAFFTKERTEKFIFPKEFVGLSSAGLVLRKEDANIKTLKDFASADFSLAPIAANNAQYTVIDEYNKENPNNKVKLKAGDAFTIDIVQWVNEGRVDGGVMIEGMFKQQVTAKDGAYNKLIDDVVYNEFAVIKTWPLFNKKEQPFADAYDKAVKQIKEEQKTNELSKKFYDRDLFEVLEKVKR
ncbi:transporter substrate-binding domain-containing protein [Viridibacillus sp. YIM B01967]|uniref:Transporter substrate-binding domain-containing protein n=1 Tax=Viridibacillus soli TaxID=2798301 RepID=A0ABS1H9A9_9BACL|nr:transporter substrate-binding domain-containing protein [Viridibacillus soli]MBK3495884.1 transporter substrate-binding domain-containing protein [Viridibacillus soli]